MLVFRRPEFRIRLVALTLASAAAACGGSDGAPSSSTGSGAPGSASSGGTGGAAACTPGAQRPCYSGPAGTADVGTCKSGVQTCEQDGTFGPCVGEVTPVDEVCNTPEDEDCRGSAP